MNKLILNVGLIGMMACVGSSLYATELNNVFHHRGKNTDLEFGKVAFYFSKDPVITRLPIVTTAHDGVLYNQENLILPKVVVHDAVKDIIQRFNAAQSREYQVTLEVVKTPTHGLKMLIQYDPTKVCVTYELFESIKQEKGFIIRFYNKELLDRMSKKDKKLLHVCKNTRLGVVVDCGHGGSDDGAVGLFQLKEKDVTLNVGRELARLLHKQGVDVFLTRSADVTVPLDRRTSLANARNNADLFVSIHANRSARSVASGVETFCLDTGLFHSWHTALNEVAVHTLHNHMTTLCEHSVHLAGLVHNGVLAQAKKLNNTIVDRKVKHAASQVLIGSNMPAVLIEIGFLSNEQEAELLAAQGYQMLVAQGICDGIVAYLRDSRLA